MLFLLATMCAEKSYYTSTITLLIARITIASCNIIRIGCTLQLIYAHTATILVVSGQSHKLSDCNSTNLENFGNLEFDTEAKLTLARKRQKAALYNEIRKSRNQTQISKTIAMRRIQTSDLEYKAETCYEISNATNRDYSKNFICELG